MLINLTATAMVNRSIGRIDRYEGAAGNPGLSPAWRVFAVEMTRAHR